VLLLVPEASAMPVSRQLVYTAVTRAKKKVCIMDAGDRLVDMGKLAKDERYGVLREIFGE
jgi:ATP-dependent exoDNAse (exonuclease V) alpha subunit